MFREILNLLGPTLAIVAIVCGIVGNYGILVIPLLFVAAFIHKHVRN